MARLICYSLRVLQNGSSVGVDRRPEDRSSSEEDDSTDEGKDDREDNSDCSSDIFRTGAVIDVFSDARRLFPWHGDRKDLAQAFLDSLTSGISDEGQQAALLKYYQSIIFQTVRSDPFISVVLHFLAVLGIEEEQRRLRQANDFSYMLAGIVYCVRVLAVEIILPSGARD